MSMVCEYANKGGRQIACRWDTVMLVDMLSDAEDQGFFMAYADQ